MKTGAGTGETTAMNCKNSAGESDEYANRIPHPERIPKYTKVKVPNASAEQLCRATLLLPLPYINPYCC